MGVATGTFKLADGSPAISAQYQWKLSIDVQTTLACVVPSLIQGFLDISGNMTSTFIFNDVMTPTTSTYQLTIKDNEGTQIWNEKYFLTGTAANINLIAPQG